MWNAKSAKHKHRKNQQDAWNRIRSKLKTDNIKETKKKRNNVISSHSKLRNKINEHMKTGSDVDEIFKPDSPSYSIKSTFLHDVSNSRKTKNFDVSIGIFALLYLVP